MSATLLQHPTFYGLAERLRATHRLRSLSIALIVAGWVGSAPELAIAEPKAVQGAGAVGDLVLTTAGSTVRARLRIVVDGKPWADWVEATRAKYVEGLFVWLDADADGTLSEAEAKRTPSPPPLPLPDAQDSEEVHFAFNFRVMDLDGDGKVTRPELDDYYRSFGGAPFRVVKPAARRSSPVGYELFLRLDGNQDGALTADEMSDVDALFSLDRDADGLLAAGEIPGGGGASRGEEFVANSNAGQAIAEALTIAWEAAGNEPADLEVAIDLSTREVNESPLRLVVPSGRQTVNSHLEADGVLVVQLAGNRIELLVAPAPVRTEAQLAATLQREFAAADTDRDDRISSNNRVPEFLRRNFDLIDRNGNQSLERSELDGFLHQVLPLQSSIEASRMTLSLGARRSGLFDLLDRNDDGSLGARELRALPRIGRECGTNGRLTSREIPASYTVVVRRSTLLAPYEPQNSPMGGPPWFSRLDRNRDGDVSAAEFPGRIELFDQLDSDRDGLIGLKEALQAEGKFRGTSLNTKESQ
jgi:Ca2+-binding EF-hand superfamily protein